jgi:hypothetical protein
VRALFAQAFPKGLIAGTGSGPSHKISTKNTAILFQRHPKHRGGYGPLFLLGLLGSKVVQ